MNILLLCDYHKNVAQNMIDHIESFSLYSKHKIFRLPIFGNIPKKLNIHDFDGVIIHYSLSILDQQYVSLQLIQILREFRGLKIIFAQDEYKFVNKFCDLVNFMQMDFVFTCIPKQKTKKIYSKIEKAKVITVLTGYISEKMILDYKNVPDLSQRNIDVFYRTREIPYYLGDLGYEKTKIAEYFLKKSKVTKLKMDISNKENLRIYGKNYFKRLMNSRVTLGTESGSSLIDYEGELISTFEAYKLTEKQLNYFHYKENFLKDIPINNKINVISPRCFESIVLKTVMILFEGTYSGILKPGHHYIELKKDFSNFNEILEKIKDDNLLNKISETAYNQIAKNKKYSLKNFINEFDCNVEVNNKDQKLKVLNFGSKNLNIKNTDINYIYKFQRRKLSFFLNKPYFIYIKYFYLFLKSFLRFVSLNTNILSSFLINILFKITSYDSNKNLLRLILLNYRGLIKGNEKDTYIAYLNLLLTKLIFNKNFFLNLKSIYSFKNKKFIETNLSSARFKKKSVLFFGHSYYNFKYLSRELRKRGWDALNVSIDIPNDPNNFFNHGPDINLYHSDLKTLRKNVKKFFFDISSRFQMVHFYGVGNLSLFNKVLRINCEKDNFIPLDLIYLKNNGLKIGFTTSGCLDGTSKSSFFKWSNGCCKSCIWNNHPSICSDYKNMRWGQKRDQIVDLYATECMPALDFQNSENCFREPLTQALCEDKWNDKNYNFSFKKKLKILHHVGNYSQRTSNNINIKGTHIIRNSINKLISQGFEIEMMKLDEKYKNKEFIEVMKKADLVIDQIIFGRYGSITREALMLNKPVICYINKNENANVNGLHSFKNIPVISADTKNFEKTLRQVIASKNKIFNTNKYRSYALKWFGSKNCAKLYERVYDGLVLGKKARQIEKEIFIN